MLNLTGYTWEGHEIGWCNHCEAWIIDCPACKNASCTGGGCEECCSKTDPAKNFSLRWIQQCREITRDWILPDCCKEFEWPEQKMMRTIFGATVDELIRIP